MVEGHGTHRVGAAHRKSLLGRRFKATSPNKGFVEGANAINGRVLSRIEVHGKHLFYFFGTEPNVVVVHIHFGMSGRFSTSKPPGPAPRLTTRLELRDKEVVAHLSAMIVEHGPLQLYNEQVAKLGPDPLRDDADGELLWAKMQTSKKAIGLVLMDQSMVAGLGNIYRAEVLFKAGLHPETPAHTVSRAAFDKVWAHSVELLHIGFTSGSIITVDPGDAEGRRYVYNQARCGRCKGPVFTWDMSKRTVYACFACQPLAPGIELSEDRAAAVATAKAVKEFVSHCAPDEGAHVSPAKLTLSQLRAELQAAQLDTRGTKAKLVQRVEEARRLVTGPSVKEEGVEPATPSPSAHRRKPVSPVATPPHLALPKLGAVQRGEMASAKEAAMEKLLAGESRAVEHVALHDDETEALLQEHGKGKRMRRRLR